MPYLHSFCSRILHYKETLLAKVVGLLGSVPLILALAVVTELATIALTDHYCESNSCLMLRFLCSALNTYVARITIKPSSEK